MLGATATGVSYARSRLSASRVQNQQLMDALTAESREVERLRGKPGDLQLTLKMLEMLQSKAKAADAALAKAEEEQKQRKAEAARKAKERARTGATPQPSLPAVERGYTLEEADRACLSCGCELRPMKDTFEESELICRWTRQPAEILPGSPST